MKKIIGAIAGLALVLVTAGAAHAAVTVDPPVRPVCTR